MREAREEGRIEMGIRTDYAISEWQKQTGINLADNRQSKLLMQLSDAAYQAIKIIQLELSGIRDGDGCWHGSDVLGGMTSNLMDLCQQIETSSRSNREIVIDIKTTGANPRDGDRLIEIGCVELVNRIPSGNTFHVYFNPERGIPAEAFAVHGLSEDFLKDKPLFAEVADDLIAFLGEAPLVSHNPVSFDLGFLNAELERAGRPLIARKKFVYKKIDGDAALQVKESAVELPF
jgi:DNA polymerase III epsilon subunit-like protein